MKYSTYLFIFFFSLLLGCEESTPVEIEKTIEIHTALAHLPKLMSLPKPPLTVKWQINDKVHHDSGTLYALLNYSQVDYDYIISNSPTYELQHNARINIAFYKGWVPQSLQASIATEEINGNYDLAGIVPLKPDLFTKAAMSPFIHGRLIPLGEGYSLVLLYSL